MHFVNAKGLLSASNGMNIYRGCTHGCIYCDSRCTCYQIHNFEDIEVKQNAPELLEKILSKKRKKCMIGTGSMSDPYMHCEENLRLTRKCLEIIEKYGFGISILTKSDRILQDLDLLHTINLKAKSVIQITLTTFNENLCKVLEPNVCSTIHRYKILKEMQFYKIPTIVWISPILPFINDTEENLRGLLNYCFDANVKGIICFGIGTTLREGSREYFYSALDKYFPSLKYKYIKEFGNSYECNSKNHFRLMEIFHSECEKRGIMHDINQIFSYLHDFPIKAPKQLELF